MFRRGAPLALGTVAKTFFGNEGTAIDFDRERIDRSARGGTDAVGDRDGVAGEARAVVRCGDESLRRQVGGDERGGGARVFGGAPWFGSPRPGRPPVRSKQIRKCAEASRRGGKTPRGGTAENWESHCHGL